jgi:hypothetical protein
MERVQNKIINNIENKTIPLFLSLAKKVVKFFLSYINGITRLAFLFFPITLKRFLSHLIIQIKEPL